MNNTSAANTSLKNTSHSSVMVPSKAEGIAWCSTFMLTSVFIVAGNLLTIMLVAVNKRLRKKSIFLVINMAFADLILGAVMLPIYLTYDVGSHYQLWTDRSGILFSSFPYMIVEIAFTQASLISAVFISCERFYAIYWPFKHRTLSMRAYRVVIFMVWMLALLISVLLAGLSHLISYKPTVFIWVPYTLILMLIICGCNIGIWRKFQLGSVGSQQQNRAAQNKRLTKTLLFVSFLALLSWLPLVVMNFSFIVYDLSVSKNVFLMVTLLSYSNSFINPVVYDALRIPEFREALGLCCIRRGTVMNTERIERRNNMATHLTTSRELRTLRSDPGHLQQEDMDTKL